MQRVRTYASLAEILSADLNQWQDNTLGIAQVPGLKLGPPYVSCTNGTVLNIGAMPFAMIGNANTTLSKAAATYTPISPALGANTWYYLYVYSNAGVLTVEHSTMEPDASLAFKSGDLARLYIGCFRTNGSGVILRFRAQRGRYLYQVSGTTADDLLCVNTSSATTFQTQSVQAWVPAHAGIVLLRANLTTNNTAALAQFKTSVSDANTADEYLEVRGIDDTDSSQLELVLSPDGAFQHQVTHADAVLNVIVKGFQE